MRLSAPVLVVAVLAVGAPPVVAQDSAQPNLCLRVEESGATDTRDPELLTALLAAGDITVLEVLSCGSAEASGSGFKGTTYGSWFISDVKPDATDRQTSAIVGTESHFGISAAGQPYLLAIRCHDEEVDLSVAWHEVIDADQPMVEVVTGSGATHVEPWNLSTDGVSTFYPGLLVESFVQSLYGETSLIVRIVTDAEPPRTAAFDIEDIEQALVNVWAACGP